MNRRTAIKLAFTGATTVGLAGCTGTSESQSTTENTESGDPAIRDLRINGEQPSAYEVSFPTAQSVDSGSLSEDEALQQVADQFAIEIQYESPVQTESTLHLAYDEDVIPKEDEDPIDQDIDTVTQQGTITHDSQVPEGLIKYMLNGNARNLNLTTKAKNTENGETTQETINLNYGDASAESGLRNSFHSADVGHIEGYWNLLTIEVEENEILFEYETSAEIGTEPFGSFLASGTGLATAAMENVRTAYNIIVRGLDKDGNNYEYNFDKEDGEKLLKGEINLTEYHLDETNNYIDQFPSSK